MTTILLSFAIVAAPAQAASSKHATIVMDARSGRVLHAENADARRYPASLTKMMTLYLTFEALSKGKIKKNSPVYFSAQAAAQPPTKIGVKAGGTITVETAIYSLITRSANDSSVALAELIGGSVPNFARMMTSQARQLGMNSTVFKNPHGLPDGGQFTTARDMARLGIALREHYPQYYSYFSTKSFRYGRTRIANHNRLLGRVKGVDGIKTGYTRASGFNLVSSVTDGNRRMVAVVMGGTSARSRDQRMTNLIAANMGKTQARGGALIAKSSASPISRIASLLPGRSAPTPEERPDVEIADSEEAVAELEQAQQLAAVQRSKKNVAKERARLEAEVAVAQPRKKRLQEATEEEEPVAIREQAYAQPVARPKAALDQINTASTGPKGWVVQIASSPKKSEAEQALASASDKANKVLASAQAFTTTFEKDGVTYHRARFGGFSSQNAATKACGQLKKKKIACYAVQQ